MPKKKPVTPRVAKSRIEFNPNVYEPNIDQRADNSFWNARTVPEMIECIAQDPNIEIDARVMALNRERKPVMVEMNRATFLEAVRSEPKGVKLREFDSFNDTGGGYGQLGGYNQANSGLIGDDYVPLLGGPFNKQQYIHDYLQGHSQAFFAFHHDPIARMIITTTRDFVLGRSFRIDCKGPDAAIAEPYWRGVEKVNNLPTLVDQVAIELGLYGEVMSWELPDGQTKIEYQVPPNEKSPQGFFPRFRLIDPSVIWDIITYPEDITRVLAYQWVAPTQYQIYTNDKTSGTRVPSLKFIYQQIPASQVDHFKVNVVSNEKRGRGDLYPILGYLKRLRDIVSYSLISEQKKAAWSIDTEIDGNQDDINAYADGQASLGTIPPAGSEFIHSSKVKRTYLGNEGNSSQISQSWEWCANMIAASTIPISYWGTSSTHGGASRASSMVATEPVAKRFEMRRKEVENFIKRIYERSMAKFGIDSYCEVTFPEIVVQDRSAKLADMEMAQANHWLSQKRVAEMASKEFDISEYDYDQEMANIKAEGDLDLTVLNPLTGGGSAGSAPASGQLKTGMDAMSKGQTSGLGSGDQRTAVAPASGQDKHSLRMNRGG